MIALLLILLAQSPADQKCRVEGTVVSSTTGSPLKKAAVTLDAGKAEQTVITGEDGRFAFDNLEADDYTLRTIRAGYLKPLETRVVLQAGEKKSLTVKLTPQGIISVRVVDEDGDPVTDAGAELSRVVVAGGKRIHAGFSEGADVDGEGVNTFTGLKPGDYLVAGEPHAEQGNPVLAGYVTTYYPGVTDSTLATVIHLPPGGEVRNIEIRLARAATHRVRGKISGDAAHLSGRLELTSEAEDFSAQIDKGGFVFPHVPPGSYILHSWGYTSAGYMFSAANAFIRQTVEVGDADVDGMVAQTMPRSELTGVFHFGDLKALKPPRIQFDPFFFGVPGNNRIEPPVDATGTFRSMLGPDRFRISVRDLPDGAYVKSIRYGTVEVEDQLDLMGGAGAPLEITLAPDAGEISGTVRDDRDEAVPYHDVKLWSDGAGSLRGDATASDGTFTFKNLAPGEYHVAAWEDNDLGCEDVEACRVFEPQSATVRVKEKSRETVGVKLIVLK